MNDKAIEKKYIVLVRREDQPWMVLAKAQPVTAMDVLAQRVHYGDENVLVLVPISLQVDITVVESPLATPSPAAVTPPMPVVPAPL